MSDDDDFMQDSEQEEFVIQYFIFYSLRLIISAATISNTKMRMRSKVEMLMSKINITMRNR